MSSQDRGGLRRGLQTGWIVQGVLAGVVGMGLLAAGCSQQRDEGTAAEPAPVAAEEFSTVANNVNVTLTADAIAMPEILSSGWTNFIITNGDRVEHSFAIRGAGVERLLPGTIQPGETQQMRVQLRPGDYEVSVPAGGSGMRGISRRVTVARW